MEKDRREIANPNYKPCPLSSTGYPSFEAFYPYYLGEVSTGSHPPRNIRQQRPPHLQHNNITGRRMHLVGTGISSLILGRILLSAPSSAASKLARQPSAPSRIRDIASALQPLQLAAPVWKWIAIGVGQGYFLAWVGHFLFEKNKPATFKYPVYSFMGDVELLWEVVTRKRYA